MAEQLGTYVRTFEQMSHAEMFLEGKLRMHSVDYFRKLEDGSDPLRGDAFEGASAVFQSADISHVTIAGRSFRVAPSSQPAKLHYLETLSWSVYCLHALGLTPEDGDSFSSPDDLKRAVQLDERCASLGAIVVYLTDRDAFRRRCYEAAERLGLRAKAALVRYFDDSSSHEFESKHVPFMKPRRFAYQKEFRLVVTTPEGTPTPFILDVGPIADIAELTTAEDLRSSLTITTADGTVV